RILCTPKLDLTSYLLCFFSILDLFLAFQPAKLINALKLILARLRWTPQQAVTCLVHILFCVLTLCSLFHALYLYRTLFFVEERQYFTMDITGKLRMPDFHVCFDLQPEWQEQLGKENGTKYHQQIKQNSDLYYRLLF